MIDLLQKWVLYTCIFLLQMLVQRQETEQELNQRIQKLSTEKSSLVERVASLQRTLANMETEKREIERQVSRQEKDKSALKKTLDKVNTGRERLIRSHSSARFCFELSGNSN